MPLADPAVIRMPLHARLTPPAAVRMNFLRDDDGISILLCQKSISMTALPHRRRNFGSKFRPHNESHAAFLQLRLGCAAIRGAGAWDAHGESITAL
jgi:hypothetical protein